MNFDQPYYGAHMSIKNGILNAIELINEVGGNLIQIFISNPMSTKSIIDKTNFSKTKVDLIHNKLIETNSKIVIHLPYVINLAKPLDMSNVSNNWWIKLIFEQLKISELIGSIGTVVHVGKYLDLTPLEGLENMYNAFKIIIDFMIQHDMKTHIILETAAGQGTELITTRNNSLEDFANFYNKFTNDEKEYIRICVDTCHIFAAGYDIRKKSQVKQFFDDFNKLIGLKYLDLIHLNDSKTNYGSCVDRHANLGDGQIGIDGLRHIIRYGIYYRIPMILETPDAYISEIKLINQVKKGVIKWSILK
jgi:deoxyribonuclease-4